MSNRRRSTVRTAVHAAPLVCLVFVATAAFAAGELAGVRIGKYADYTRVVLETDEVAGHRLEQSAKEVRVQLDVRAKPQTVKSASDQVTSVSVTPAGGGTEVRVQLKGPVELRTLALDNPPRLVLDLYTPGRAPGSTAAPKAVAKSPAPKAAPPQKATPPDVAEKKAPTPAATAPLVAATTGVKEPEDSSKSAPKATDSPKEGASPLTWDDLAAEDSPKQPEAASPPPAVASKPAPVAPRPTATPAAAQSEGIPSSTILFGALLLLAVIGFVVVRRRRNVDEEESASVVDVANAATASGGSGLPSSLTAPSEPPRAGSTPPADEAIAVPGPQSSIFDEPDAEDEDKPPTPYVGAEAPGDPVLGATAPSLATAPSDDFTRRVGLLETRLEELANEKERLERQVVAQTEELRVQRAAIARTQRVLRGLQRPEEEATEPVPK